MGRISRWWATRTVEVLEQQQRELEEALKQAGDWRTLTNQHMTALQQAELQERDILDRLDEPELRNFSLGRISAFEEASRGIETLGRYLSIELKKPK